MYLARKTEDGKEEYLIDHLQNVANLSRDFANVFGAGDIAYNIGLLHDIGKYSPDFQERLNGSTKKVDHSTIGAIESMAIVGVIGAFCIEGHHKGLSDMGTSANKGSLYTKLTKEKQKFIDNIDYKAYKEQVNLEPIKPFTQNIDEFGAFLFIKMMYSCLVDADFLATEKFMQYGTIERDNFEPLSKLKPKLDYYLKAFGEPTNKLNEARNFILHQCNEKSTQNKGLYSLTVPTGGGKTLSSLQFAINHAISHNMDRLIFVIPYTSIIEQTAQIFKDIFGEDNVIEHHSQFDTDKQIYKLATENWDAPIIITTNVQFFESLYANKSSRCRKLHNICNSVIIFDETQMLPTDFLKPSLKMIEQLVKVFGCTALLCSATQPTLDTFFENMQIVELVEGLDKYEDVFARITIIDKGTVNRESLIDELNEYSQVLCIVNTREEAKTLAGEGWIHLSTHMYPVHRKKVIAQIKEKLKNKEVCKVVSTSLIEAGVDVDFPVVYRELNGIDSIIQAGGRCNREGKNKISKVYIFKIEGNKYTHLPTQVAEGILYKQDINSKEAITQYFKELYYVKNEQLDKEKILEDIKEEARNMAFSFKTIANKFRLIESYEGEMIIIPNAEIEEEIQSLQYGNISKKLVRKLALYSVNVAIWNIEQLCSLGAIKVVKGNIYQLIDLDLYSEKTGLDLNPEIGIGIII